MLGPSMQQVLQPCSPIWRPDACKAGKHHVHLWAASRMPDLQTRLMALLCLPSHKPSMAESGIQCQQQWQGSEGSHRLSTQRTQC